MDVSAASSLSLYSYQSSVAGGSTQAGAALQALTSAYKNTSSAPDGTDALTALVGQSNLSPLVSAIYTQSATLQSSGSTGGNNSSNGSSTPTDTTTAGIQGLTAQTFGGMDSSAASTLLSGLTSDPSSSGLQGFDSSISSVSALASTAAQAAQTYGSGSLTSDAQSKAATYTSNAGTSTTDAQTQATANGDTSAVSPASPASPSSAYALQAAGAAQLAAVNNTFNLLA